MNKVNKTIDQLREEKRELHRQLNETTGLLSDGAKDIMKKLRENEEQTKQVNRQDMLSRVNREQAKKRELALLAWNCEEPTEDITCNDGSFHKVKVKKYPNLSALSYASAKFKDGKMTELRINGEKFQMYRGQYEYNKPTVYTRPESFADFLALNSIMPEDMTAEKFQAIVKELNAAEIELKKNIEQYKNRIGKVGYYSLNYFGLLRQHTEYVYTYTPNN